MYTLQQTSYAHNDDANIGRDSYVTVSTHRTISAAVRALRRHQGEEYSLSGGAGYSHNHRILGATVREVSDEWERQASLRALSGWRK